MRKGRPPKPGGLDKVLYIRTDKQLREKLKVLLERRNRNSRGSIVSLSDMVRSILWDAIDKELDT